MASPEQARPITDFMVQSRHRRGAPGATDWDFSPVDLNLGVGGMYIYCGWTRKGQLPATHLKIGAYGKQQAANPWVGWSWSRVDLNEGAGGSWIYLGWDKQPLDKWLPIYQVQFLVTTAKHPPTINNWSAIDLNLNRGSGGPKIFMYATFDPQEAFIDENDSPVELRVDAHVLNPSADQIEECNKLKPLST